jgi:hypothetical protein
VKSVLVMDRDELVAEVERLRTLTANLRAEATRERKHMLGWLRTQSYWGRRLADEYERENPR